MKTEPTPNDQPESHPTDSSLESKLIDGDGAPSPEVAAALAEAQAAEESLTPAEQKRIETALGIEDGSKVEGDGTVIPPAPEVIPPATTLPPEPPATETGTTQQAGQTRHVYFKKAMVDRPFAVDKKPVRFEVLGENTGVIELDPEKDAAIVAALEKAAHDKRGGIVKIDAARYEELKKKLMVYAPSGRVPKRNDIRIAPTQAPKPKSNQPEQQNQNGNAAGKDNSPSEPAAVRGVGVKAGGVGVASPAIPFEPPIGRRSGANSRPKPIPPLPDAKVE